MTRLDDCGRRDRKKTKARMPTNGARPLRYGSRSTDEPASASIAALQLRLAARDRVQLREAGVRRAAVLVPLVSADDGLSLLCFERTHDVLEHKGEICFPGGSIDPVESGPVEAALREANEELGIEPGDVDVLGLLDDVHTTVSNYAITPVVGYIPRPRDVVCDALE